MGRVLQHVVHQRLQGLLAWALEDDAFPITPDQVTQTVASLVESESHCLVLERTLLQTAARFERAGIEFLVLKGPAIAHLAYPDPSVRLFGDVDVLVRGAQFDEAARVLSEAGLVRRFPEPRPRFDARFTKGVVFSTDEGLEVDLHRTFVAGPFGLTVDLDGVFDSGTPFVIGARTLQAMGLEERLVHACYHAALGDLPPRLMPLRDVVELSRIHGLDHDRVRYLTARWRAEAVVARRGASEPRSPRPRERWFAPRVRPRVPTDSLPAVGHVRLHVAGPQLPDPGRSRVDGDPGRPRQARLPSGAGVPDRAYIQSRHAGRIDRWRSAARNLHRRQGRR